MSVIEITLFAESKDLNQQLDLNQNPVIMIKNASIILKRKHIYSSKEVNYCSNEEFILAMTDLGYNSQPSKTNECNINFNIIETKELRDFKKERYSK